MRGMLVLLALLATLFLLGTIAIVDVLSNLDDTAERMVTIGELLRGDLHGMLASGELWRRVPAALTGIDPQQLVSLRAVLTTVLMVWAVRHALRSATTLVRHFAGGLVLLLSLLPYALARLVLLAGVEPETTGPWLHWSLLTFLYGCLACVVCSTLALWRLRGPGPVALPAAA